MFFLEELDTLLPLTAENLGFAAFGEHTERSEHDILIHSMPFCDSQRCPPK